MNLMYDTNRCVRIKLRFFWVEIIGKGLGPSLCKDRNKTSNYVATTNSRAVMSVIIIIIIILIIIIINTFYLCTEY